MVRFHHSLLLRPRGLSFGACVKISLFRYSTWPYPSRLSVPIFSFVTTLVLQCFPDYWYNSLTMNSDLYYPPFLHSDIRFLQERYTRLHIFYITSSFWCPSLLSDDVVSFTSLSPPDSIRLPTPVSLYQVPFSKIRR